MCEQGRDAPELLTPVSIAVVNDGGNRLVYVIDAGYSHRLVSIASVDVSGDLVLTVVNTAGMSSAMGAPFFPSQTLRVTTSGMGITSMLYVDSTNKLKSGLDLPTSLGSLTAAGSGLCVMPAQAYNVTSANLCGNLYLDAGEQCDTGGVTGTGCNATCQFETDYKCLGGASTCLSPCRSPQLTLNLPRRTLFAMHKAVL